MTLSLAQQYLEQADRLPDSPDHSAAGMFAREIVQTHQELRSALQRYEETQRRANALAHENESLRARQAVWVPAVHVRCDRRGCTATVAFDPLPEEARLVGAMVCLGWGYGHDGRHWCPEHGGGR